LAIPRQDFETRQGRTIISLEQQVLEFLSRNRDTAFTPLEIVQGIWEPTVIAPNDPRVRDVSVALDNLITRERVSGKALVFGIWGAEEHFFTTT
jgi:DNA-binding response OmpR family regulator